MKTSIALAISSLFLLVSSSLSAQNDYIAPRTEWGQPDLQGVWNFSSNVPMQRPERFGNRRARSAIMRVARRIHST